MHETYIFVPPVLLKKFNDKIISDTHFAFMSIV
jgi:hypothetical protein